MPVNKNAYIRYLAYDKCLRNRGRLYKWSDLLDSANRSLEGQFADPVGKTQFFKDIKVLKGPPWNAPIVSENSHYRYSDPDFSITNQPLNDAEAEQLRSAVTVLSRFKGLPQFEWVQEIIPKIEKHFNLDNKKAEVIGFDQNIDLKGLEHFGDLFNAIIYKQVLLINYHSFKSKDPVEGIIHPYYLKQYNNRWFLFGYNPEVKNLTNRALDRIVGIEISESTEYIENTTYDFDEYFEDMIGVTKTEGVGPQIIKLWFSKDQAPYIDSKPLHGTQKGLFWDETGMIVTIEVIPNVELEQLILRHGEHCRVLEPLTLKGHIKNRLNNAFNNYS